VQWEGQVRGGQSSSLRERSEEVAQEPACLPSIHAAHCRCCSAEVCRVQWQEIEVQA